MNRIDRYWDYHAMVKRNERIIRTLCLRYRGDDAEGCKDLAQEVRIGLWQRFMARSGIHHVRAESRSTDMETGKIRSAMAVIVGVMNGSA